MKCTSTAIVALGSNFPSEASVTSAFGPPGRRNAPRCFTMAKFCDETRTPRTSRVPKRVLCGT